MQLRLQAEAPACRAHVPFRTILVQCLPQKRSPVLLTAGTPDGQVQRIMDAATRVPEELGHCAVTLQLVGLKVIPVHVVAHGPRGRAVDDQGHAARQRAHTYDPAEDSIYASMSVACMRILHRCQAWRAWGTSGATRHVASCVPHVRVPALSTMLSERHIARLMEAGTRGVEPAVAGHEADSTHVAALIAAFWHPAELQDPPGMGPEQSAGSQRAQRKEHEGLHKLACLPSWHTVPCTLWTILACRAAIPRSYHACMHVCSCAACISRISYRR